MKPLYFSTAFILFLETVCIGQKIITNRAETTITAEELVSADFSTKTGTYAFISKVILKKAEVTATDLSYWTTDKSYGGLKESAIIFLRHGYDQNRLNPTASVTTLGRTLTSTKEAVKKANELLLRLRINSMTNPQYQELVSIDGLYSDLQKPILGGLTYTTNIQNKADVRSQLISITEESVKALTETRDRQQTDYDSKKQAIVENAEVITTILHAEETPAKGDGSESETVFSDYLLKTRKILVIILGGDKDIANASVEIENKVSEFETSWNDLKALAQQMAIPLSGSTTLKCKVFEIDEARIKPPSTIIIKHESFKEDRKIEIHETGHFVFRAGLSASYIKEGDYKIEDKNLVITLDDNAKKLWKDNLMAFAEFSFTARDYDRFSSIFKNTHNTSPWERLGVFAACKISTRPWETLATGFSFSLSKDISLNAGLSIVYMDKEQTLKIGDITSLDQAKKLADKEYSNPRLFLAISFAPRMVTEVLGLSKKAKD